jgi:hypothetical protein
MVKEVCELARRIRRYGLLYCTSHDKTGLRADKPLATRHSAPSRPRSFLHLSIAANNQATPSTSFSRASPGSPEPIAKTNASCSRYLGLAT